MNKQPITFKGYKTQWDEFVLKVKSEGKFVGDVILAFTENYPVNISTNQQAIIEENKPHDWSKFDKGMKELKEACARFDEGLKRLTVRS